MRIDDCYLVGYIVKTHGLKGDVILKLDVDHPEEYQEMESILLDKGGLVPFFISSMNLNGDRAIIHLEDIDSLDEAKEMVGKEAYLTVEDLPELPEGGYFYHDLIGCAVIHEGKMIGSITQLYQPSIQFIAEVTDEDGGEILVPITDEIFVEVDLAEKRVIVDLPEGLLEIYKS